MLPVTPSMLVSEAHTQVGPPLQLQCNQGIPLLVLRPVWRQGTCIPPASAVTWKHLSCQEFL